jgi:threonine dehydrogenase-like Zn-dependent dehydrogenase
MKGLFKGKALMKALVLKKPGELMIEERAKPVPKSDEVLLKVLAVGVCGTDLHSFKGKSPLFKYPGVMGHELALQIAEIPPSAQEAAKGLHEGDFVTALPYLHCGTCISCRRGRINCCVELQCLGVHTDGGMQEYMTLPVKYLVPAGRVPSQDLSIVECFSIGFHGVRLGGPDRKDSALVVGAGPIGIGVIHGLKERGVSVIALDINEKRLGYAKDTAQADYVINATRADPEQALRDITGGEMPSFVFEATGNGAQMIKSINLASYGGVVVFIGYGSMDITYSDINFHKKELALLASRNATKEDFAAVIAGMESGRVNTAGFVTHTASLEEAVHQFASWTKPETGCVKAVINMAQ